MGHKLRLGMVGGGAGSFIGPVHAMAARLDGGFELVAGAFSRDNARNLIAAESYGVAPDRTYATWQAMLAAEAGQIDVVAIVTPNDTHLPIARAALEAGFDVLSDKPATLDLSEALTLREIVRSSGKAYGLTYTYSGYPLVREARALITAGALGQIRKVVVEYPQGWLSQPVTSRQGAWRTNPTHSGLGGCITDIGIHAFHLAEFVSGLEVDSLIADLGRVVPGRTLDDDCDVLLHFRGGARGALIASQISAGDRNAIRLRVYGENGGLDWSQETPNSLTLNFHDRPSQVLHAGADYLTADTRSMVRLPVGHPEGYIEAFANLYRDFAVQISTGAAALVPGIDAGVRGMAFVETAVASSAARQWKDLL